MNTTGFSITSRHLKWIGCAAMFIDHLCVCFFPGIPAAYIIRLTVGRLAFPIFAYLLVEGFTYSRNRKRYAIMLLITAIASETFFNILVAETPFNPQRQNTCFTLFLGLIMCICLEKLHEKHMFVLEIIVLAVFALLFLFFRVDYDITGARAIAAAYYLRYFKTPYGAVCCSLVVAAGCGTPGALLAIIPLFFYKHERGKISNFSKYAFYAFYPLHLIILIILKTLI